MKRILVIFMLLCMMSSLFVITAYAENVPYAFTLSPTGKAYNTYTGASNTKMYYQAATVSAFSHDAPGWGFAFCMRYEYFGNFITATQTSPAFWIGAHNEFNTVHPTYLDGLGVLGRNYYVGARLDDDIDASAVYSCSGYFNSDYTNI